MKTQILKQTLKNGLSFVERATAKAPTLPILQYISLSVKGNTIELAGTDLEMGVRYWALAKNKREGRAVIPPRVLSQLLTVLPDSSLELEVKNNSLVVSSAGHTASIRTLNPEEFPLIPSLEGGEETLHVDAAAFCQGINQTAPVSGQSQARPEISGVLFSFQKDGLRLVATDSFRLAEKTVPLQRPPKKELRFILPQRTAKEFGGMFGEKEGQLAIAFSSTQAVFDYSSQDDPSQSRAQVVSRLLEGEYPPYEDVIPKEVKIRVLLDRAELLNKIRAASIFTGKGSEVRLALNPGQKSVEVSSQSGEVGETSASFTADISGSTAPLSLSFNWRFLADGLAFIKSPQVELRLTSEEGAALVLPGRPEEQYRYVVMPVKA